MRNFFRKNFFLVSFWPFYILKVWKKSSLKISYLYYKFWTSKVSEEVVHKCPINKLLVTFCQSSLATLIKKRLRHRCISVNLAKFLKSLILQKNCKWLVLDFAQFYTSHSIIHFIIIKRNSKKGNSYFLNVFNRISASENCRQKK